ncbi:adropin isoform X1 [Trachypithecus francoisi]|uniref:adropin isoform X1 n=1 Tax=Trachypithecus francoisi TaxID=54180 RepID=UPI00141A9238|nr:adropin isoform X1 [Trachypithecus francoisi]
MTGLETSPRYREMVSSDVEMQRPWPFSDVGCTTLPGVEGARNPYERLGFAPSPPHPLSWERCRASYSFGPPPARRQPERRAGLHPSAPPMVREPGLGPPIEWRQRRGDGSAPGPQAAGLQGGGALRCFLLAAEPGRAQPNVAELSRAQPNAAELSRTPRSSRRRCPSAAELASSRGRGGGAAPRGGGARSPQTARGRGRPGRAAAGAAGGGGAAEGEGRGSGRRLCWSPISCRPPPAGSRALVGAEHPAAPDPPAGAHQAQLRLQIHLLTGCLHLGE